MSFSMEELISSFASNHIGQDAMNLAALQVRPYLLVIVATK
jgi:hypothetical protein